MRLKHSWALALLLTGCQLTQQPDQTDTDSPTTHQPTSETVTTPSTETNQPIVDAKPVATPVAAPQSQQDVWQRNRRLFSRALHPQV